MKIKCYGSVAVTMLAIGLLALPVISTGQDAEPKSDLDDLLRQRRETLRQVVEYVTEQYHLGKEDFDVVAQAKSRLINSELEIAKTRQERLALLRKQVEMFEAFSVVLDERFALGVVQQTDLLDARVAVLDAKIDLVREQNRADKTSD